MVGNPGGSGTPILSLFSPRVALAAPELAARAGYFGQIPPNGWVPVEVIVRNKEATAFRGQVEVRQVAGFGAGPGFVRPSLPGMPGSGGPGAAGIPGTGGSVAVRWRVPVEVPPGEDRHVIPWIWWDPGSRYEVHLVDESGRSVASTTLQESSSRADTDTWVGVVFGDRSIPYLRTLPGVRGGTVVAAEAMPYVLPRSSAGWFGFDAVVIDGAAVLQHLQPDQIESLRLWVKLGGTLVLGTGSDAAAMARVLGPELFPWTVRDTVEISSYDEAVALARHVDPEAPDLGEDAPPSVAAVLAEPEGKSEGETGEAARNAGADGQDRAGGRNGATERAAGRGAGQGAGSSIPLTYRADVGLGRVYVWATRLDSEPWLSWSGMPDAIAGWLGADLAPGQVRRADSFAGGHGMRSGSAPDTGGGSPSQATVPGPLSIEAGGPRALALALARGPSPMTPSWSTQDILLQAGRDLPGLQLPTPGVMAAGIAGYLLVIGPVTFGLLRRRRRREWAWVAVPALALASIAVAYGASTALGAAAPRNAAGFLFVTPDGDRGLWSGAVATYRPAGSPALDLGRGVLVAPARSSAFGPPPDLEGGGGLTVEPALAGTRLSWPGPVPGRIPVARVQMDVTLGGTLRASWRPAGTEAGDWDVEVVNGLDFTLKNLVIISGGQTLDRLPDLAPGEAYRGRVRVPSRPAPGPWMPVSPLVTGSVAPLVAGSPAPGPAGGQGARTWRDRQEARLQQALAEASYGMASGAVLVATVDGTPLFGTGPGAGGAGGAKGSGTSGSGTGDRQATPWSDTGMTLLIQPLVPTFPAAGEDGRDFFLTNAVVPLAMREARATSVDSPNTGAPVQVENGVFEMEWQPPAAVAGRASTLRIQLPSSIGIELYDHAEARWVTLRVPGRPVLPTGAPAWLRQSVRLAERNELWITGAALGRFFGPDGRLHLRLTVEGQAALPMPILSLEVRGEVTGR